MHILKLQVEDDIYKNVMFLLDSLKSEGLKIEELGVVGTIKNQKKSITELLNRQTNDLLKAITDPVDWQRKQRSEW